MFKYRKDIDGLRALAILAVVGFHGFANKVYAFKGGFIGVDIFFVISGFLITSILLKDLDNNKFSLFKFYAKRVRRIFPALIIMLIATYILGYIVLFPDEFKALGKHIFGGASFLSNFFYWNESGYFDTSADTKPLLHLWSLGIEEQFYIVLPIFLFLYYKFGLRIILGIFIFLALSFGYNVSIYKYDQVLDFYSPLTRAWELLAGSLLAYGTLYHHKFWSALNQYSDCFFNFIIFKQREKPIEITKTLLATIGFIAILAAIITYKDGSKYPGIQALAPVLGAILIIAAGPHNFINQKIFSNKFMVFIGLISYPLYLWHWPLLSYTYILSAGEPTINHKIIAVGLSVVLAILTYLIIERPIRHSTNIKAIIAIFASLMLLCAAIGAITFYKQGFSERHVFKKIQKSLNFLAISPWKDEAGIDYARDHDNQYKFIRYSNIGSDKTIAVVGDSHAVQAYTAIEKNVSTYGYNRVMLQAYPWYHSPNLISHQTEWERASFSFSTKRTLELLLEDKKIKQIFIINRGFVWINGYDVDEKYAKKNEIEQNKATVIDINSYIKEYQKYIDRLKESGKEIYIVTENPVFQYNVREFIQRPLSLKSAPDYVLTKQEFLDHEKDYLNALHQLKNVTIIDSTNIFCPDKICPMFNEEGLPLYVDDDHLSNIGADLLVEKLLKPYILKP